MTAAVRADSTVYDVEDLLSVTCPACDAEPKTYCVGISGRVITSIHTSRVSAAEANGIKSKMSKWSDTIAQLGRESRQRDQEILNKAVSELPERIAHLSVLDDETLVKTLVGFCNRGHADPRLTIITTQYADACVREVMFRLTTRSLPTEPAPPTQG